MKIPRTLSVIWWGQSWDIFTGGRMNETFNADVVAVDVARTYIVSTVATVGRTIGGLIGGGEDGAEGLGRWNGTPADMQASEPTRDRPIDIGKLNIVTIGTMGDYSEVKWVVWISRSEKDLRK